MKSKKLKIDEETLRKFTQDSSIQKKYPLIEKPKCRFCGGECRALNNNGIIGSGYREWNYVCNSCGRVQ